MSCFLTSLNGQLFERNASSHVGSAAVPAVMPTNLTLLVMLHTCGTEHNIVLTELFVLRSEISFLLTPGVCIIENLMRSLAL